MKIAAAFVFAVWLALAVAIATRGPELWWVAVVTFLFMGLPPLLYLLPAKGDRMAGPKNFITFDTTLPGFDGPEEDERGEPLPAGAPALRALGELLSARGHAVGEVVRHSHYGWAMDIDRAEAIIQGAEGDLLLIVHGRKTPETLAAVLDALGGDSRFSEVEAMTPGEHQVRERAAALAEHRARGLLP